MQKSLKLAFFILVCLAVTAAFWVSKEFLFPFVTTKAFFFRISVELALPCYVYFLVTETKLRPNLKNPVSAAMLAFLSVNLVSAFTGADLNHSLWGNFERMGGAYYVAHLVALYFYVVCLGQMQAWYLQRFLKVLLWVGIVVAGNGLFGWLHLPTLVTDPSLPGRVSSTLGNPIYLGSFLIIPFFLSLFFAHQAEGMARRVGYYFLALVCLMGIFLSGTRGAVVGLLLAIFFAAAAYFFFSRDKKIRFAGFTALGACVLLALLLFNFSDKLPAGSVVQRVFHLQDSNSESRLLQWQVALRGFKDRPLLGTGPENYYIIANRYYNPAIYKYDASWFDKPHNYLLEILVTDGSLGFLAYASILVFLVMALFRGYKGGLYSLLEFCFLLAGLLAYQIQNLFVFDTVPASLMFFSFAGFGGYIWGIAKINPNKSKNLPAAAAVSKAFAAAVFALSLIVMAYAEYATNFVPMAIAKNVNYGYAYASVDPAKAYDYFHTAIALPFNFDETETASKFGDFVQGLARTAASQNQALAVKALDDSVSYLEQALRVQPNNPILWERLATGYLYKSVQVGGKIVVSPKAIDAASKAIALAPKRNEAYLSLAQIRSLEGNYSEAEKILLAAIQNLPTDKSAKVQLAGVYRTEGKLDQAVQITQAALAQGYNFSSYAEIKWLIDYYAKQKEYDKALALQEQATKVEPNNLSVYMDLARLFAQAGQLDAARNLAQNILNSVPSAKTEMQACLDSLPKTASSTQSSSSPKK